MKNVVMAFGTRPDQIKLAPLAKLLNNRVNLQVWYSGQGWDMRPAEYQYVITTENKIEWDTMTNGVSRTIAEFGKFLDAQKEVDLVIVHGDDATAYACAVAAFLSYHRIAHIEAGMRTYDTTPYPEESFRRQIGSMATLHFAPSSIEVSNLKRERVNGLIYTSGNTVNDTLEVDYPPKMLVTLHRRENWGEPIVEALRVLGNLEEDFEITVIEHPNWKNHLSNRDIPTNLVYIPPQPRDKFMGLVRDADLILTDSGGLQEECALLGKDCIVYRKKTERATLEMFGSITLADPTQPFELEDELVRWWKKRFSYGIPGKVTPFIVRAILDELGVDDEEGK